MAAPEMGEAASLGSALLLGDHPDDGSDLDVLSYAPALAAEVTKASEQLATATLTVQGACPLSAAG